MSKDADKQSKLSSEGVLVFIKEVQGTLLSYLEKGLFVELEEESDKVRKYLSNALEAFNDKDFVKANDLALAAEDHIHRAYYRASWIWRCNVRFRPFIVLYSVSILLLIFYFGWSEAPHQIGRLKVDPDGKVWGVPLTMLAFGASGALLRVLYWVNVKVARGDFRPQFQLSNLLAPWIGALFGAITFAVVQAGLWTFQEGTNGDLKADPWAAQALAALAGFSWEWVIHNLTRLMERAGSQSGNKDK